MMFEINNIPWKIYVVSANDSILLRSNGVPSVGVTDNQTKTIYISDLLSRDFLEKVVSHELVHAFSFSYGLYIPIDTEEQIADFLATYGREVFDLADSLLSDLLGVKKVV